MLIIPITTPLLRRGSDLASEIRKAAMEKGDVLVVSSKAVAMCEGADVDLASFTPSVETMKISKRTKQDPRFVEFVLQETKRMNGTIVGTSPYVILTSLKPKGLDGRILCPNAGADQSNIGTDRAIGWPVDPVASVKKLSGALKIPVIISDSCSMVGRSGVVAMALVACGIEPFQSEIGKGDLFGKPMQLTREATADQLATAANTIMGNAAQSTPAAIIRGRTLPSSDFCGWIPGMDASEDLFQSILKE